MHDKMMNNCRINTYVTNYGQNAYFWTFKNFLDFPSGYPLPASILIFLLKIESFLKITRSIGCPSTKCWLAVDEPQILNITYGLFFVHN
jgi:hypothetical protein